MALSFIALECMPKSIFLASLPFPLQALLDHDVLCLPLLAIAFAGCEVSGAVSENGFHCSWNNRLDLMVLLPFPCQMHEKLIASTCVGDHTSRLPAVRHQTIASDLSWVSRVALVPQQPRPPSQRERFHRLKSPSTFSHSATRKIPVVRTQFGVPTGSIFQENNRAKRVSFSFSWRGIVLCLQSSPCVSTGLFSELATETLASRLVRATSAASTDQIQVNNAFNHAPS